DFYRDSGARKSLGYDFDGRIPFRFSLTSQGDSGLNGAGTETALYLSLPGDLLSGPWVELPFEQKQEAEALLARNREIKPTGGLLHTSTPAMRWLEARSYLDQVKIMKEWLKAPEDQSDSWF